MRAHLNSVRKKPVAGVLDECGRDGAQHRLHEQGVIIAGGVWMPYVADVDRGVS